jgi:hypothetical protein
LGRQQAVACIPDAGSTFEQLLAEDAPTIDMLSPLGTLLVNQRDQELDGNDNDFTHDFSPEPEHPPSNTIPDNAQMPLSHTHDRDLEDAIADEMPRNNIDSSIVVQGQKMSKAKALHHRMAFCSTQSSTDCLKHVQNIPCFGSTPSAGEPDSWSSAMTTCNNTLGPSLRVGNPVALLIRCDALVVLAVAQVNRLRFVSHSNLDELAAPLLADPTAKVDCQILHLLPTTVEDDPTHVHDWCWSMHMEATCENVDGQYCSG